MELIDTWNTTRYICKVLLPLVIIVTPVTFTEAWHIWTLSDIKIYQSIYLLILIVCPMYSYVLYYNIEKSGFNVVSAYLLYWFVVVQCNSDLYCLNSHQ